MPTVNVTILAIGGGGAGGADAGGGGGGGGASTGSVNFDLYSSYLVAVGSGGGYNSQPGQASYVQGFSIIAYGGQGGGSVYGGFSAGGYGAGGSYNVNGGSGGTGARGGNPVGQPGQTIGTITGAGGGGGEIDGNDGSPVPGGSGGGLAGRGGFGAGWNQKNNTPGFPYGGGGGGGGNYGGSGAGGASGVVTLSYTSEQQLYRGGTVSSSGSGTSTCWTHTFTSNGQLRPNYAMGLPTSGPLSLSAIQHEFGGNTPISLSEYYKGGIYVNDYSLAPHVPRSGTIKISDFYGSSHYLPEVRTVVLSDGQSFTVPETIQSGLLQVTLVGAPGGTGGNDVQPGYGGYPGQLVTGFITVAPRDAILASVGGTGVGGGSGSGGGTGGVGGSGGIFGYSGGSGGNAGASGWSGGGGGGGGATAIKLNGAIVGVAAGGAGGGGGGWYGSGHPSQGYSSSGSIAGGQGSSVGGADGGGGGGGGGGQLGGAGGSTAGEYGGYSGSTGANLIPPAGSAQDASSTLYNVSYPTWCDFLNSYGVWPNPDGVNPVGSWVTVYYNVTIPTSANYLLRVSGDNHIQVYIYGNLVGSFDSYTSYSDSTVALTAGATTIRVEGLNDGGPAGFAAALYNPTGSIIWNTRNPTLAGVTITGTW